MAKKSKLKVGDHVVLNAVYAKIMSTGAQHEATLLRPAHNEAWQVTVHYPILDFKPQTVHEKFMERFSEVHVGTMTKEKVKLSGFTWTKTTRDQWVAEDARIKQLDAKTFSVMRGKRYLGSEPTLEAAAERARANDISERNRKMREWERYRPTELPPLKLSEVERAEYIRRHPEAGRGVAATAARGDSVRAKVATEVAAKRRVEPRAGKSGERDAELRALLKRGCTREDILRVTGWKAVSVQAMAKSLGVGLRVESGAKPYKYYSTEEK